MRLYYHRVKSLKAHRRNLYIGHQLTMIKFRLKEAISSLCLQIPKNFLISRAPLLLIAVTRELLSNCTYLVDLRFRQRQNVGKK